MSDSKKPNTWEEFANKAKEVLRSSLRPKARPNIERSVDLRKAVERGRRAKDFLASNFFVQELGPLFDQTVKAGVVRPWKPGDPIHLEEFHAEYLFCSGQIHGVSVILTRVADWINEGEAAAKELAELEQRSKVAA